MKIMKILFMFLDIMQGYIMKERILRDYIYISLRIQVLKMIEDLTFSVDSINLLFISQ